MKKPIKTIIVDDEPKSRNLLSIYTSKYCPLLQVVGTAASIDEAEELINKQSPEVIFLDIQMPRGTGFDLLERVDASKSLIVFVTSYDEYAIKAIKHNAFDYILKPVGIDELTACYDKIVSHYQVKYEADQDTRVEDNNIIITSKTGVSILKKNEIVRCKADGSCTWFYLEKGERVFSTKNLGEYEHLLSTDGLDTKSKFYRSHYSDLINLNYVVEILSSTSEVVLTDGSKLKIASRRKKGLIEALK